MAIWDVFKRKKQKTKTGQRAKSRSKTQHKKKRNLTQKSKKIFEKKPFSDLKFTENEIENWKQIVKVVQDHPLSQARVINDQLLGQLSKVLEQMNSKLDTLVKLDYIISLLEQSKKDMEGRGVETKSIDLAIKELKALSLKDQEAYEVLKKEGALTTEEFAQKIGISRSTASTRLNKMYQLGLLDKKTIDKKVLFEVKKHD